MIAVYVVALLMSLAVLAAAWGMQDADPEIAYPARHRAIEGAHRADV